MRGGVGVGAGVGEGEGEGVGEGEGAGGGAGRGVARSFSGLAYAYLHSLLDLAQELVEIAFGDVQGRGHVDDVAERA